MTMRENKHTHTSRSPVLFSIWPCACYLHSLNFIVFICRLGIIIVIDSQGLFDDFPGRGKSPKRMRKPGPLPHDHSNLHSEKYRILLKGAHTMPQLRIALSQDAGRHLPPSRLERADSKINLAKKWEWISKSFRCCSLPNEQDLILGWTLWSQQNTPLWAST